MVEKTLCILPCAGLGTRMNMKPNESKEMLPDPKTDKPLIDYSLDLCKKYDLQPLIITRKEKTDLIEYIDKRNNSENISLLTLSEINGEWPETILRSEPFWNENNILMLPDTRFEPDTIIESIKNKLNEHTLFVKPRYVFGMHIVDVEIPWGLVENIQYMASTSVTEKPIKRFRAWGVIGFKKNHGELLFQSQKQKNQQFCEHTPYVVEYTFDSFKDITRSGKLEDY